MYIKLKISYFRKWTTKFWEGNLDGLWPANSCITPPSLYIYCICPYHVINILIPRVCIYLLRMSPLSPYLSLLCVTPLYFPVFGHSPLDCLHPLIFVCFSFASPLLRP